MELSSLDKRLALRRVPSGNIGGDEELGSSKRKHHQQVNGTTTTTTTTIVQPNNDTHNGKTANERPPAVTKKSAPSSAAATAVTKTGLAVLVLLCVQNCSKSLLMRAVMKERPKFLTSTAVLGCEVIKLVLSVAYIRIVQGQSFYSVVHYMFVHDVRNTFLILVPACAYNFQMFMEYFALARLDAATFSVVVQCKLLFTALVANVVLRKKLRYIQVLSLVLLTTGVMLCSLSKGNNNNDDNNKTSQAATTATRKLQQMSSPAVANTAASSTAATVDSLLSSALFPEGGVFSSMEETTSRASEFWGILATLCIAVSSGLASVYTEKVIKGQRKKSPGTNAANARLSDGMTNDDQKTTARSTDKEGSSSYGLAYTQVQLAVMCLLTLGLYAVAQDWTTIAERGLFQHFTPTAWLIVVMSSVGGLTVAAVLKYADSVLKGYATALSVILTGILSSVLFGTALSFVYVIGMINVVVAVLLYNGTNHLDQFMC